MLEIRLHQTWISPNYPDHLPCMPCSLPRRTEQVHGRFLPCPRGLPRLTGGSASTTSLSRPAQASLALRPARSQPAQGGLLSRGSDQISYLIQSLGSYHVLPTTTWMDPPSIGDLRRWGALLTSGWGVHFVRGPDERGHPVQGLSCSDTRSPKNGPTPLILSHLAFDPYCREWLSNSFVDLQ